MCGSLVECVGARPAGTDGVGGQFNVVVAKQFYQPVYQVPFRPAPALVVARGVAGSERVAACVAVGAEVDNKIEAVAGIESAEGGTERSDAGLRTVDH